MEANGSPLNPNTVSTTFRKVAQCAILTLRLHDLSHSHATIVLKANVHPEIVSEHLGHANIGITLDNYSYVGPGL